MRRMAKKVGRSPRRDAGRPRGAPILDSILGQTLEEIAAHGIEGLSIDRIARAAEVNRSSVYRRWPTRGALVAAALERVLGDVSASLPDTGSLVSDLRAVVGSVARLLEQPLGRALLRAALSEAAAPAVTALASRTLEQQLDGPAHAIVERARRRGEWRPGVPAEMLSLLVGAVMHRAMLERRPVSSVWIRQLVDLVVEGVRPR